MRPFCTTFPSSAAPASDPFPVPSTAAAATVPAATGQLQLAQLYDANNKPAEANKIYAQLKAKDQTTAAGQIAAQKLAGQH